MSIHYRDDELKSYFTRLESDLKLSLSIANDARRKGTDFVNEVEITLAPDVAGRVEGLVGPPGIKELIRELVAQKKSRDEVAFEVAKRIVDGSFATGKDLGGRIEQAIRTGVAVLTEGVLVAPTEGISAVKIEKDVNSTYLAIYFSGPIRSAGGTAAALTVLLGDYIRQFAGIGEFHATDDEAERYVEEINLYDMYCAHLQYRPSDSDIRWVFKNCKVCIAGDPTEDVEVSVHRNLIRMGTNRVRGGVALVSCEGIAQKARKVYKYAKKYGLNWDWLEKLIKEKKSEDKVEIKPNDTFLEGLVAGRPVFSYPSAKGGFRMRYGRTRFTGIAAKAIHPATMVLLDNFPALGTQFKVERPGKGTVVTPCDSIMGPIVRLKNGDVVYVESSVRAKELLDDVDKIIFLGDMLISYNDFLKSNHPLVPSPFVEEIWDLIAKEKGINERPKSVKEAFDISRKHSLPLYPEYLFFWSDISIDELKALIDALSKSSLELDWFDIKSLSILNEPTTKSILESLGVVHTVREGNIILASTPAYSLLHSLGMLDDENRIVRTKIDSVLASASDADTVCSLLTKSSGIEIRRKSTYYIGTRMGRPEKAAERMMDGSVNCLFPIGMLGGKDRSVLSAIKSQYADRLNADLVELKCSQCGATSFSPVCPSCGSKIFYDVTQLRHSERPINLKELYEKACKRCEFTPQGFRSIRGLSNSTKIPEPLEKGLLRAKNNVYVFKDGTCRFDSTDVPVTHFKPREIGTSIEKLLELGYTHDVNGQPLTDDGQLVEMFPQDVILSENAIDFLLRVSHFIDDLLIYFYGMKPFYGAKTKDDILGHLVITLSPHTSAGVLGRVIGFINGRVGLSHPYVICARRRNCFSGEENIPLFDGKEWSFRKLSEIVNEELAVNSERDAFGNEFSNGSKYYTLALNKDTMRFELSKVSSFSRHIPQEHMVHLISHSGREIVVTGDHPLPKLNGSGMEKAPAFETPHMFVPATIEIPVKKPEPIDLLSISIPDISVKGDFFIGQHYYDKVKSLGISYKTFTDYVYSKSVPVDVLNKLGINVPKDALISAKRDTVTLQRMVAIDEDLLFLLGFYIAEGYARKHDKGNYQVCFTACNPSIRNLIVSKIKKVFNVTPSVQGNSIVISSRILYSLFVDHLKIGEGAYTKNVPSFVYSSPKPLVAQFLAGYFTGDGSVSKANSVEVSCTSVNKKLIDEVSFLLARFGIKHGIAKSDRMIKSRQILDFYCKKPKRLISYKIRMYGEDAAKFITEIGFASHKQEKAEGLLAGWKGKGRVSSREVSGDVFIDPIVKKDYLNSNNPYTYSLTVDNNHNLIASNSVCFNCDGDEDAVMLLMDAFLNFSRLYLPETRGSTMDAPLVMTTIVDPSEVDDEVHAMELVKSYGLDFYKAADEYKMPSAVKLELVESRLNTSRVNYDLHYTHEVSDINDSPVYSEYVQLKTMKEKLDKQFSLYSKIRAVDAQDAADKLLSSHFIPDIYGNLRAFSRQAFRCGNCNNSYRRVPLSGRCEKCNGKLLLTINKGGIEKYIKLAKEVVEKYHLSPYTMQRLEQVEKEISSIFEDETKKQSSLAQFL